MNKAKHRILAFALAVFMSVAILPYPASAAAPIEDRDYDNETVDIEITSDFTYTKNMQTLAHSRMVIKSPAVLTIVGNIDFNASNSTFLIEPGAQVVIAPSGSLYFEFSTTSAINQGTLINHGRIYGNGTTFVNNGTMVNCGVIDGLSNSKTWQIDNQGQFHIYGTVDNGCSFTGGSVTPNEISSVTAALSGGNTASVVVDGQLPQQGAVYVKVFDEYGGDTLSPNREAVLQSGDGLTVTGSLELPPPSSGPVTYIIKAGFDGTYWAPATDSVTVPAQLPTPVIATQGGGTEIPQGGALTLEVTNAAQYNAPAYQWYRNGVATGANSATLNATEEGRYKVAVTDVGQTAESSEILLTEQGAPSASTTSLTIQKGETADFTVDLGEGAKAATSANILSSDTTIATATPPTLTLGQSGTVTVKGEAVGSATISIGYSGGNWDGHTDKVQVTVTDATTYTITFDPNGGTVTPTSAQTGADGTLPSLPTPTRSGHSFEGWFSGPVSGMRIDTTTIFAADMIIYAQWTDDGGTTPPPPPSGGGGSRSSSGNGGSSTPDSWVAKTQLPASAFSWDGSRTLTINHEHITPLGLLSVRWNDVILTRGTEFGVYEGSVIIRFSEDFIVAQAPGNYTVWVEFPNHTGETTVTVGATGAISEDDNNETYNPNTGGDDRSSMGGEENPNTGDGRSVWTALLLGSLGAAAMVLYRRPEPVEK